MWKQSLSVLYHQFDLLCLTRISSKTHCKLIVTHSEVKGVTEYKVTSVVTGSIQYINKI